MNFFKVIFFSLFLIMFSNSLGFALEGKVIEKDCPFNCKTAGIKKKYCQDWKKDGKCYIKDSSPRIYIEKKKCPYSCKTLHLPSRECKDYKEAGLCVVERTIGLKF